LLILQNKLALLFNKDLLVQSKQKILVNLTFIFYKKFVLLFNKKLLAQSKQKILIWFDFYIIINKNTY